MQQFWNQLPVVVRAVLTGLIAGLAGTLPWAALVGANTRHWVSVPWSVPITVVYLWIYWKYARGFWWPRSTSEARRTNSRVNPVAEGLWGLALFAGLLGLWAVVLMQGVLGRLVTLPQQQDIDPSKYPVLTVFLWAVMGSIVAGVVEEISFRGYMQRPLERRYGPVAAIMLTGILFGFGHFSHPEVTMVLLPFYVSAAAVYGTMAYLTDSVLPSMVLHAGGDVFSAFNLFALGRSEWQGSIAPRQLVWVTGFDAAFWGSVAVFVVVGSAAVWAFIALASAARTEIPSPS